MNIEWGFWDRNFDSDINEVPKSGERKIVYVSLTKKLRNDDILFVLWVPSYTQFNGWDDKADEISGTYIVECKVS